MRSAAGCSITTCRWCARIVRDAAAQDYRFSALMLGIVKSAPFQMRAARRTQRSSPESTQVS